MKKIILSLVLTLSLILQVQANSIEKVILIKCVDGDTAIFNINGVNTRVRFLGIDTPESVKPNANVEAYGKLASNYTCDRLTNAKEITLEYDDNSDKEDRYDRVLAWVLVDNSLLEAELVEKGYAKVKYIYDNYKYTELLYEKQSIAKEQKLGIWSDYEPITYEVIFSDGHKETKLIVEEGEKVKSFIPQKNGYKFIGWFIDDEKFDFDTRIFSNIILTARYEKDINILEIVLISVILLTMYYLNNLKIKKRKVNNHGK